MYVPTLAVPLASPRRNGWGSTIIQPPCNTVRCAVARPGHHPDLPARAPRSGSRAPSWWGSRTVAIREAASHDTGRPKSQASGPTDQPSDKRDTSRCCPREQDWVMVTAMGAVPDSVASGTDQCPDYARCHPNTPIEASSPAPKLGAGDLIDGGRRLDLDQRTDQHLTVLDARTSSMRSSLSPFPGHRRCHQEGPHRRAQCRTRHAPCDLS